jgi:hypothetical protein
VLGRMWRSYRHPLERDSCLGNRHASFNSFQYASYCVVRANGCNGRPGASRCKSGGEAARAGGAHCSQEALNEANASHSQRNCDSHSGLLDARGKQCSSDAYRRSHLWMRTDVAVVKRRRGNTKMPGGPFPPGG